MTDPDAPRDILPAVPLASPVTSRIYSSRLELAELENAIRGPPSPVWELDPQKLRRFILGLSQNGRSGGQTLYDQAFAWGRLHGGLDDDAADFLGRLDDLLHDAELTRTSILDLREPCLRLTPSRTLQIGPKRLSILLRGIADGLLDCAGPAPPRVEAHVHQDQIVVTLG